MAAVISRCVNQMISCLFTKDDNVRYDSRVFIFLYISKAIMSYRLHVFCCRKVFKVEVAKLTPVRIDLCDGTLILRLFGYTIYCSLACRFIRQFDFDHVFMSLS